MPFQKVFKNYYYFNYACSAWLNNLIWNVRFSISIQIYIKQYTVSFLQSDHLVQAKKVQRFYSEPSIYTQKCVFHFHYFTCFVKPPAAAVSTCMLHKSFKTCMQVWDMHGCFETFMKQFHMCCCAWPDNAGKVMKEMCLHVYACTWLWVKCLPALSGHSSVKLKSGRLSWLHVYLLSWYILHINWYELV